MENLQELISNTENTSKTRVKKPNKLYNDEVKNQMKINRLSILEEDEEIGPKDE
jgi:hypothetical protein